MVIPSIPSMVKEWNGSQSSASGVIGGRDAGVWGLTERGGIQTTSGQGIGWMMVFSPAARERGDPGLAEGGAEGFDFVLDFWGWKVRVAIFSPKSSPTL